ncbi:hypothetical protein GXP67_24060 [Rhodocytophaga rosea]|uniref:Right-handed parallel beta-helix repeat-containing protein n=1 Tax=Rhodocytophaga rosea TaxID=2704465 RepID=A0A6C0GN98_9BACT|nr:choice-of-anchor Q domain-containing protein [Rhodocytophaga rosea]QHT69499.1 hypothetical protein GXP67_24060 [Rhodocytophaga rosea]
MLISVWACTPDEEIITTDANARLTFSENAVVFDTIFSGIETITRRLTVYNPNKKALSIDQIYIGNSSESSYDIIINGRPLADAGNIRLLGGDSLLVLVKARITPRNDTLPFVVYDSLMFETNSNVQNIKLLAWGQDAHFIRYKDTFNCNITWVPGKPYVLLDSMVIKPGCTLTINPGTQVYSFTKAHLIIQGTLDVQGTPQQPVIFADFQKLKENAPGQWGGIVFEPSSTNNHIYGAEIRNATIGLDVRISDADTLPDIKVENTIIKNMLETAVSALNSDISLTNVVLTNCINTLFAGQGGGNYSFRHCTLANYNYEFGRELPAIVMNNTYRANDKEITNPLKWNLQNSIIWGNLLGEILFSINPAIDFEVASSHNILKTQIQTIFQGNNNLLNVKDKPLFADPTILDFMPEPLSPLIDAGRNIGVVNDVTGKERDETPDIGAYEL